MTTDQMLNAFATFFVTIDPPGQIAIFLALTVGLSGEARRKIALFGSLLGIGIILLFMIIGAPLLELLGISLPAFRVAGGLLLFYTAFEMVFEKRVAVIGCCIRLHNYCVDARLDLEDDEVLVRGSRGTGPSCR